MFMRYHAHIVTSLAATVALAQATDAKLAITTLAGVTIGSLLPDIDEPRSYVGNRSMGASNIVKFIFGHRGFTHSILAMIIMLLPLYWILHLQSYSFSFYSLVDYGGIQTVTDGLAHFLLMFFYGLGLGYILHILEDMFSIKGVPLLYPIKKKIAIKLYRTGGKREKLILFASILYIIYQVKDMVIY